MAPTRRAVVAGLAAGTAGCLTTGRCGPPAATGLPDGASARIGFGGDAMLGRSVTERWRDGPPAGVWGSLHDRLTALDGLVVNLECTVSDSGRPDPARTYRFRAAPGWALSALDAAGVDAVCLANNHQLDYGPAALRDSLSRLDAAGVARAGAGTDLRGAVAPATTTVSGLDVVVVAATDQAPSDTAAANRPGVATTPLSAGVPGSREFLCGLLDRAAALEPDLLVASLHWGPNWRERPSEGRRRLGRWLVDRGVDVVHGHSAHVVQGVETYRGRPICYDTGDLVDDYVVKPDLRNDRSALFEVVVADGALAGVRIVPTEIRDSTVHRAGSEAAAWLRATLRDRSADFGTTYRRAGDGLWVPLASERPPGRA